MKTPTFYKIHRYLSIFSFLFFFMLCITGLILLFRTEIQGNNHAMGAAPMNINTLWDGADQGAAQFTQKYPTKEILNISPAMGSHLLRYRIIDKNNTHEPRARMGMGGDYIIYNPHSQQLMQPQSGKVTVTPIRTVMHVLHELHTRLALDRLGLYLIGIISLICGLAVASGAFLYGPFSKAAKLRRAMLQNQKVNPVAANTAGTNTDTTTTAVTDNTAKPHSFKESLRSRFANLHRELMMLTVIFGFILSISGTGIAAFFILNDNYNKDVAYNAKIELSTQKSDILTPSEAIFRVQAKYPGQLLISMDYPSRFNGQHYAFYLGRENDEDPALFLGQPIYANLYKDGQQDHFYSQPIPWYFTGLTTLINLHIHNHNTMALKIVWGIWMVVLSVASLFGAFLTFQRWGKWTSWLKTQSAPSNTNKVSAATTVISTQTNTCTRPIAWSVLTIIGMWIPLTAMPYHNEIALVAMILPLLDMVYILIKR